MLDETNTQGRINPYYDRDYFENVLKPGGPFSSKAELFKFEDFIKPSDAVVDFGCGGGFLLAQLPCSQRIGVEVNPSAQENCRELGVPVVADLAEIPHEWADIVISNHALEHTYDPFHKVRQVYEKLKPGGTAVFVVPCERYDTVFKEGDINQHLYTWSPMNLGNLFACAGFQIVECRELVHRWPPKWGLIQAWLGWDAFHAVCCVFATLRRRCSQVRVVAKRP